MKVWLVIAVKDDDQIDVVAVKSSRESADVWVAKAPPLDGPFAGHRWVIQERTVED